MERWSLLYTLSRLDHHVLVWNKLDKTWLVVPTMARLPSNEVYRVLPEITSYLRPLGLKGTWHHPGLADRGMQVLRITSLIRPTRSVADLATTVHLVTTLPTNCPAPQLLSRMKMAPQVEEGHRVVRLLPTRRVIMGFMMHQGQG